MTASVGGKLGWWRMVALLRWCASRGASWNQARAPHTLLLCMRTSRSGVIYNDANGNGARTPGSEVGVGSVAFTV
jgi:hypothetical protein